MWTTNWSISHRFFPVHRGKHKNFKNKDYRNAENIFQRTAYKEKRLREWNKLERWKAERVDRGVRILVSIFNRTDTDNWKRKATCLRIYRQLILFVPIPVSYLLRLEQKGSSSDLPRVSSLSRRMGCLTRNFQSTWELMMCFLFLFLLPFFSCNTSTTLQNRFEGA